MIMIILADVDNDFSHDSVSEYVLSKICSFIRNQDNLTLDELDSGGVAYETTVLLSDLRDNPAYTTYYTFLTRYKQIMNTMHNGSIWPFRG